MFFIINGFHPGLCFRGFRENSVDEYADYFIINGRRRSRPHLPRLVMIPAAPILYAPGEPLPAHSLHQEVEQQLVSTTFSPDTYSHGDASAPLKTCSGTCGRTLPLSSFGVRRASHDGRFHLCKQCRRLSRGPRGREGQSALALERALADLLGDYQEPSLADVLTRAIDEVRQIGATGYRLGEQVEAVRRAVLIHGCRRVDEIVEETRLSRWVVEKALELLLAEGVVETRDAYRLGDEAEEAGRPVTEYHPRDYPRGEGFTRFFRRPEDADEPHELEVEP